MNLAPVLVILSSMCLVIFLFSERRELKYSSR